MTRFVTLDHVYPAAWNSLPHSTDEEWFQQSFGTSDFLDIALRAKGHECHTLVLNGHPNIYRDMAALRPDVVISREVGRFNADTIRRYCPTALRVAFCSHRADDAALKDFHVVFSSFKWMPDYCKSIGVRCEYLPLAFGRPVLTRLADDLLANRLLESVTGDRSPIPNRPLHRDIDVAFVGGLGNTTWKHGTAVMARCAEMIQGFSWWGYYQGSLSDYPAALQRAYKGEAYGAAMYKLLHRTKVLVNRHGEIAARGGELFGNNNRQYEALGCGCRLLTDDLGEIPRPHATRYTDPDNAAFLAQCLVAGWHETAVQAAAGQRWLLQNGCYENRVEQFLSVVESL